MTPSLLWLEDTQDEAPPHSTGALLGSYRITRMDLRDAECPRMFHCGRGMMRWWSDRVEEAIRFSKSDALSVVAGMQATDWHGSFRIEWAPELPNG